MTVTPTERLYRIAEEGLCIGCGICQSIAGPATIRVVKTTTGDQRPIVVGSLDDGLVDRIYDICPGTRIEGLPEVLIAPETAVDPVWGPYLRIVLGYAADPEVRHKAATGGVLSALAVYLLDSGRVEFIHEFGMDDIEVEEDEPESLMPRAPVVIPVRQVSKNR